MYCKNCNGVLPEGAAFCPSCGTPVAEPKEDNNEVSKYCMKCGTAIPDGETECPNCRDQKMEEHTVVEQADQKQEETKEDAGKETEGKQEKKKKIILAISAAVLVVLLICSTTLRMIGCLVGVILFPVFLILWIVCHVRKKPKKTWGLRMLVAAVFVLLYLVVPSPCTEHTWTEATCTEPEVCSTCGETNEGTELGHDWLEADCTKPKTCSRCGATEGEPLEHTPGEWEVATEATTTSTGERVIRCSVCGEILETEEIEKLPELTPDEYKAQCQTYSYDAIARSPGEYNGKYAKISGRVVQVQQSELLGALYYTLRIATVGNYDGIVYVTYSCSLDDARILEDDHITMWGQLTGEETYTTVMGNSITIPSFTAEYVG